MGKGEDMEQRLLVETVKLLQFLKGFRDTNNLITNIYFTKQ